MPPTLPLSTPVPTAGILLLPSPIPGHSAAGFRHAGVGAASPLPTQQGESASSRADPGSSGGEVAGPE